MLCDVSFACAGELLVVVFLKRKKKTPRTPKVGRQCGGTHQMKKSREEQKKTKKKNKYTMHFV